MMFVVLVGLVASIGALSLWRRGPRVRNRPGRRRFGPGIPATIAAASDGGIDGDDVDFGMYGGGDDCGAYDGGHDVGGDAGGYGDAGSSCGSDGGSACT